MKKAEVVLICIAVLGFVLSLIPLPGGNILKILSVTSISLLYMYFSFALFNKIPFRRIFKKTSYINTSIKRIFGAIGIGFVLAILSVGILFKLMDWSGAAIMLITGLISGLAVSITVTVKYFTGKSDYYLGILKRIVPFTVVGVALYLIPSLFWVEIAHRDHPRYLEAYRKASADPENQEMWQQVSEEQRKLETGSPE